MSDYRRFVTNAQAHYNAVSEAETQQAVIRNGRALIRDLDHGARFDRVGSGWRKAAHRSDAE